MEKSRLFPCLWCIHLFLVSSSIKWECKYLTLISMRESVEKSLILFMCMRPKYRLPDSILYCTWSPFSFIPWQWLSMVYPCVSWHWQQIDGNGLPVGQVWYLLEVNELSVLQTDIDYCSLGGLFLSQYQRSTSFSIGRFEGKVHSA